MKKYNVVIVGGGSHRNPDLMAMLASKKDVFPLKRVVLYDNEAERQEIMGQYGEILMREYYPELEEFIYTTDPDVAFKDVDFALMQIRAGRLPMREKDEKIPLAHGCVGQETCGAGGFAYGLRSVPAIIELVKQIRKHSPEAWILNYSNPAAIVAEATKRIFPDDYRILNICDFPEYLPNTYLKYYLYPRHVVEESDPNYTRANEVMDGKEKDTYNMMKEVIKLGALKGTKYELDPNRGVHATYIVDLATSIANNTNDIFLIITKNRGCIPNLDSEMMVEVACRVGANGVEPLAMDPVDTFYKGLLENQYAYEKLTVDGFLECNKLKLLQALVLNRTVVDTDLAKVILDDLIEANKAFWPEFK